MKVKTLRPVYLGGREHPKGETIDLPEKRARALLRLRRVEKLKNEKSSMFQGMEQVRESAEEEKPKRQYRRRDMKAEGE